MTKKLLALFAFVALANGCASMHKDSHQAAYYPDAPAWAPNYMRDPAGSKFDPRQARRGDIADKYQLMENGDFFRFVGNDKCQITNNVQDFKISMHPQDAAVAYFIREGDLYVLHNAGPNNGRCPGASKKVIMSGVKQDNYKVTSNTHTTIVNAALDNNGNLSAWDNAKVVYQDQGVEDFMMNQCFGAEGKSFNSYVLFSIDRAGHVTKVRVDQQGWGRKDTSTETSERFNSISEFKDRNNVCN
jgi:hypothetical protein